MIKGANPIKSINGKTIPSPSMGGYNWELQDVSESDAGRTEDGVMHKLKKGQVEAITLTWNYITFAQASQILQAFQSEYFMATYWSPLINDYVTKECYVGNRTSSMYNTAIGRVTSLSFKIITRKLS